jgi:hypothetical protein
MFPNDSYTSLGAHYNATLATVMVLAAIDAFTKLSAGGLEHPQWLVRHKPAIHRAVRLSPIGALAVAVGMFFWTPASWLVHPGSWPCRGCVSADAALGMIPNNVEVAADTYLAPHLVDRTLARRLTPTFADSVGQCLSPQYVVADRQSQALDGDTWITPLLSKLVSSGSYSQIFERGDYVVLRANSVTPRVPSNVCT